MYESRNFVRTSIQDGAHAASMVCMYACVHVCMYAPVHVCMDGNFLKNNTHSHAHSSDTLLQFFRLLQTMPKPLNSRLLVKRHGSFCVSLCTCVYSCMLCMCMCL